MVTLENSKYEPDGHTHTEDCYQIVKTDAVTELDCPWINHTHTKECYDADGNLICDYRADYVVHIHDEYCYDADGNLVCSLPEIERHQHDDSCYNDEGSLICGIEEEEGHQHDDKCIKIIREASEEKILDCPYANSGSETEDEGDNGSADEQSEGTQEIAGSSLPVGGKGTHCVLSGHRGLPSAKLFTNLDKLAEGDTFMLRVLNETLTYEVDQILIVLPDQVDALEIEEGRDYCTLVTCTPYGINTHRLLVRGHRVPNTPESRAARITSEAIQVKPALVAVMLAVPVLAVLIVGVAVKTRKR